MHEERHIIKVNIFGSEYAIRGEADETYIQSLAHYVDEKMKEISQSTHLTSPLKISILAAINMADEIFRLRGQAQHHPAALPLPSQPAGEDNIPAVPAEAIAALSRHIQTALNEE
ncbi:cell division protein ZapA [candidate division FCPU426 bacterium]|nr:cell division protein ZapA [candidate division FCPU426 bacterium]